MVRRHPRCRPGSRGRHLGCRPGSRARHLGCRGGTSGAAARHPRCRSPAPGAGSPRCRGRHPGVPPPAAGFSPPRKFGHPSCRARHQRCRARLPGRHLGCRARVPRRGEMRWRFTSRAYLERISVAISSSAHQGWSSSRLGWRKARWVGRAGHDARGEPSCLAPPRPCADEHPGAAAGGAARGRRRHAGRAWPTGAAPTGARRLHVIRVHLEPNGRVRCGLLHHLGEIPLARSSHGLTAGSQPRAGTRVLARGQPRKFGVPRRHPGWRTGTRAAAGPHLSCRPPAPELPPRHPGAAAAPGVPPRHLGCRGAAPGTCRRGTRGRHPS